MITLSVAQLMAQFSKVLAAVPAGERIGVLYGKSRVPVAMIVPYETPDLPTYPPDLNPIEQAFAKIKHWMRDAQMHMVENTWRHLGTPPATTESCECHNYVRNPGYGSTYKRTCSSAVRVRHWGYQVRPLLQRIKGRDVYDLEHAVTAFDGLEVGCVVEMPGRNLDPSGKFISRAKAQKRMLATWQIRASCSICARCCWPHLEGAGPRTASPMYRGPRPNKWTAGTSYRTACTLRFRPSRS